MTAVPLPRVVVVIVAVMFGMLLGGLLVAPTTRLPLLNCDPEAVVVVVEPPSVQVCIARTAINWYAYTP